MKSDVMTPLQSYSEMNREQFVLAALLPSESTPLTPVQVQKLFFLLDRNIPKLVGGPHFAFRAYDYGPFDVTVYRELESQAEKGLVRVENAGTHRRQFSLTEQGLEAAREAFSTMPVAAQKYVSELSRWIRSLTFRDLVSAIYQQYPEMKVNSVFRGAR
jgi:hypothetical protein